MNDNVEREVFAAYNDLHKRDVLHCDIRKENILVLEDESVCIIDFGNACILPVDDAEHMIMHKDEEIMSLIKQLKNDHRDLVLNGSSH